MRHLLIPAISLAVLAAGCGDGREARPIAPAPGEVLTVVEGSDVVMVSGTAPAAPATAVAGAGGAAGASAPGAGPAASGAGQGSDTDRRPDPADLAALDDDGDGARHTVAGLGDPARPGMWMETPLVAKQRPARVVVSRSAKAAHVTLIPSGGAPSGGSRLSLEAMRVLGLPLTDLVELDVYLGG
ncbi:MAG: hypothetical protein ACK5MY_02155 [Jhaorihella sp.]